MFSFPLHGLAHVLNQANLREELRSERRLLHCPAWHPPFPMPSSLCPTQQHSSVCPSSVPFFILPPSPVDVDIPAADSQQKRGKRCVTSRSLERMDIHCSELQRMCLLEAKGKIRSDVKGVSIFTHFPELPTSSQQSGKLYGKLI